MNNIEIARSKRAKIELAVKFYNSVESALMEFGDSLEWDDLFNVPEWLTIDKNELQNLTLIAGVVFLLPTIRSWIESRRIQQIRSLVGETVFDIIMRHTKSHNTQVNCNSFKNIKIALLTAGSSVIISSQDLRLRPWLKLMLPKAKGTLDKSLAVELMNHSLFIYKMAKSDTINNQSEEGVVL